MLILIHCETNSLYIFDADENELRFKTSVWTHFYFFSFKIWDIEMKIRLQWGRLIFGCPKDSYDT